MDERDADIPGRHRAVKGPKPGREEGTSGGTTPQFWTAGELEVEHGPKRAFAALFACLLVQFALPANCSAARPRDIVQINSPVGIPLD